MFVTEQRNKELNMYRNISIVMMMVLIQGSKQSEDCPSKCKCNNVAMTCSDGYFPSSLPQSVSELTLNDMDLNNSYQDSSVFGQLTKLELFATSGDNISERFFSAFRNLTYLGIHGEALTTLSTDTFVGLDNLLTLNLTSNPLLPVTYISMAVDSGYRNILQKLESLIISDVATVYAQPVDLGTYFFRSVFHNRFVRYLDISGLNINLLNFSVIAEYACHSVETFIVRRAVIPYAVDFLSANTCQSLRTLDLTEAELPVTRSQYFSFRSLSFFCWALKFYFNIENLFLDKMNKYQRIEVNSYELQMQTCPLKFRKISVAENRLQVLNFSAFLHPNTAQGLRELNFSNNELQYISPAVFQPSVNLQHIDLSHNQLGQMVLTYPDDFGQLLNSHTVLETLNISHNNLRRIPRLLLKCNTMLRYLDLSFNLLETLDVELKQLVFLEELNIVNNKIKTIGFDVRINFESIFRQENKTASLKLSDNPLECDCIEGSRSFIQWIRTSTFIKRSPELNCQIDKQIFTIGPNTLNDLKKYCTLITVKTVATFGCPVLVVIIVIVTILSVHLVRKRRKENVIKEVISRIENNSFPMNFLVFFSFSSEDFEPAFQEIYPRLSSNLSQMTASNKELVCVGDKHFRPGFSLRYELIRCISESSVFIAAVSSQFCQKHWCKEEFREAYDQNKPIILIMLEHVDKHLMDPLLKKAWDNSVHASWITTQNISFLRPDWDSLCRSVLALAGEKAMETKTPKPEQIV